MSLKAKFDDPRVSSSQSKIVTVGCTKPCVSPPRRFSPRLAIILQYDHTYSESFFLLRTFFDLPRNTNAINILSKPADTARLVLLKRVWSHLLTVSVPSLCFALRLQRGLIFFTFQKYCL